MKPKIVIATSLKEDKVSLGYFQAALRIHKAVDWLDIAGDMMCQRDICRSRARMVRIFLESSDATHLLFLDADVAVTPDTIRGMLAHDEPFVFTPYPRRSGINWDRVKALVLAGRDPLEAQELVLRMDAKEDGTTHECEARGACVAVHGCGMGCTLVRRDALQQMTDAYREAETFLDDADGAPGVPTVGLFNLMRRHGYMYSEDNSFAQRWRDLGGKVWMYLGEGSPVKHQGTMVYEGHRNAVLGGAP